MSRAEIRIAILGDRNLDYSPHYAMQSYFSGRAVGIEWIPTPSLAVADTHLLEGFQGIIAGSGPYQSKEGVIKGIRYARQNNIPFIGTCSGFGYAVLELGQSLTGTPNVLHPYESPVIPPGEAFLQSLNYCNAAVHSVPFEVVPGTLTSRIYSPKLAVQEQSHCSYGVNQTMIRFFEDNGLTVAGHDQQGEPKIMEYVRNDFFIIVLFLPQWFRSPSNPHPLLEAFLDQLENEPDR